MNIQIYTAYHKPFFIPKVDGITPIHVGAALSEHPLPMLSDATGDSISSKNPSFCELTGLYWVWKNVTGVDAVGFCHYRRHFDCIASKNRSMSYGRFSIEAPQILNALHLQSLLETSDVILPIPMRLAWHSIESYYRKCHPYSDWDQLLAVLRELHQNDFQHYTAIWQSKYLMVGNMMILKWADFNDYMTWLFGILSALETVIDPSNRPAYQKRVFGYLAERLLTAYMTTRFVQSKTKTVSYLPTLFVQEPNAIRDTVGRWKAA